MTDVILLDEAQNAHQEVYGSGGYDNQAKFSHELIAGGAAFEGMKLFEDHQRKEGKKGSHTKRVSHGLTRYPQARQFPTSSPKSFSLASSVERLISCEFRHISGCNQTY
jgi:hypothetical protein